MYVSIDVKRSVTNGAMLGVTKERTICILTHSYFWVDVSVTCHHTNYTNKVTMIYDSNL
jgi:hypothetical protein